MTIPYHDGQNRRLYGKSNKTVPTVELFASVPILGSLTTTTATPTRTSLKKRLALKSISAIKIFYCLFIYLFIYKKWIRSASNFFALIPSRLIRQTLVTFVGVEFESTVSKLGKRKRKLLSCVPFHVVVVQRRLRNVQKAWWTCKVVVCQSNPLAFLPFSLLSPLLKLPINSWWRLLKGTPMSFFRPNQGQS